MSHSTSDAELLKDKNTARFCLENRQISWVLLIATILWGVYGYYMMPKRKDPVFPINRAAIVCPWPGVAAAKVEDQITRKLEAAVAGNVHVERIESVSRSNLSIVYIVLEETEKDISAQWDDINLKLDAIQDLPEGAGPINFLRDFGETAALMLTVSSPKADNTEISWRASEIEKQIGLARAKRKGPRTTALLAFPTTVAPEIPRQGRQLFLQYLSESHSGVDLVPIEGPGFVGVDGNFGTNEPAIQRMVDQFFQERLRPSELHPDAWNPVLIGDIHQIREVLTSAAGDKYSLKQLDTYTDLIQRTLQSVPIVSKVTRSGVLPERIYMEYSQERLASLGIQPSRLPQLLGARSGIFPGGLLEVNGKNVLIDPSSEFKTEKQIGNTLLGTTDRGAPVYLRDGMEIYRGYDPPLYLNYYITKDKEGHWQRDRAVTLSIFMREGKQIADFGHDVDVALGGLKGRLPEDLALARTSDQPQQVEDNISLFMSALVEAVVLVVLLALIGFWEWRSALLMAISIPLTLAMTFGMMSVLGIDVQQVSIASLIIALGLLVDDPVVAIDAIKRELDNGRSPLLAAWLGPTKLATAILFATVTNIVAYLPMLLITGITGAFMYSLPVVLGCSLVASRIVSMTFIPLLGFYLLRRNRKLAEPIQVRRTKGFAKLYYTFAGALIDHRKLVLTCATGVLGLCLYYVKDIRQVFFPHDLSYLSFIEVWLPEDASIASTDQATRKAELVIKEVAAEYGKQHLGEDGKPRNVLYSLTSFVGGGGPRFWYSVAPEILQPNYSQILIQVTDKRDTEELGAPLQEALSAAVPGARIDFRQLETGQPIGIPVQVRISGESAEHLRKLATEVENILRTSPRAARIRNSWGTNAFTVKLDIDSDRANLYGVTNRDIALSSAGGMTGLAVTSLREGDKTIPAVSRLQTNQRTQLADIENLYAYSLNGTQKVPVREFGHFRLGISEEKIARRNQFRTVTVQAFAMPGSVPAEVMNDVRISLEQFKDNLPPGYTLEIGGEEEERIRGFGQVTIVLLVSTALIFLALVFQFKSGVKPMIVFAAIPFGMVGALAALLIMDTPFGFIAFLGVVSLIGVIVSHVIVLFDFIEEAHAEGEAFRDALLDAGILRLRPVLITVGATVIALVPLAEHGGPLWEPLCYAQIGGLLVATVVTLLLVPVLYAFFVLDLRWVQWTEVKVTSLTEPSALH